MINYIFIILFSFCCYGYGIYFKKIINFESEKINNLDIFFGFYFLCLISLIINFFLPLKIFSYGILIFGILIFLINLKKLKFNFLILLTIILFIFYISLSNGIAIDSKTYHLQIIEKFFSNKIIIGFSNLDHRYGNSSPWHLLMSLFYFNSDKIGFVYYINVLVLAVAINEIYNLEKNYDFTKIILFISICFLLIYSIIHPSGNGLILTLMGSPDLDFPAMIFFVLSVYCFLLTFKNKNYKEYLIVIASLCFFLKLSYAMSIIFLIRYIYLDKNFYKNKLFIINKIFFLLFFIRSLLISGCFIYPVKFTCVQLPWTDFSKIELVNNILTSFGRVINQNISYMNFDYTLNSYDWLIPWFQNYFLKNSLVQITIISLVSLMILFLIKKILKKKFIFPKNLQMIYLVILLSFVLWIKALDTRYLLGVFVIIISLSFSIIFINFQYIYKRKNLLKFLIPIFIIFLTVKNYGNYKIFNKNLNYEMKSFKYEKYDKDSPIVSPFPNSLCGDIEKFCVYKKNFYTLNKKFNYLIINELK